MTLRIENVNRLPRKKKKDSAEALVSGHPRESKKMPVTGPDGLRECPHELAQCFEM